VVRNLLANAIKFTPECGNIDVTVAVAGQSVGVCNVQVDVADSGIGISDEQQARLFYSFEQGESGSSRKYGGNGLGLAISKSLVELMGGHIWVESKLGEGAKFSFVVPLDVAEAAENDSAPEVADGDSLPVDPVLLSVFTDQGDAAGELPDGYLAGHLILVAEDVDINREIVGGLLGSTGVGIDYAENGHEAVQKFLDADGSYELILMDMQMPEMDGLEATEQIRASQAPGAKSIPIIALTANVFKEDIAKCLAAGMNGHIGKPIDPEVLIALVRSYVLGEIS
jgi:CheY-like chemotaxis protein